MGKKLYLSIILEIGGLSIVLSFDSFLSLGLFYFLHGLSSLILSYFLAWLIPEKQQNKKVLWALFFLIYFTGAVGMFLSFLIYIALSSRKIDIHSFYETTSTENLPRFNFTGRKIGEGMLKKRDSEVVFYVSQFAHPISIKFLKETASINQDEMRLLAFSTLTNLEKNIVERISLRKKHLEEAKNDKDKFEILYSLGELYWEMVYLNLSDKELIPVYLNEALNYVQEALKIKEDSKLYFLLGRIYLKLSNYDFAREAFSKSLELGFPSERVLIYLIEALYYKKDFAEIFNILKKFKNIAPLDSRTESILKVWR